MSKQYKITLNLDIVCENEDSANDGLMDYLSECVRNDDSTGFLIVEMPSSEKSE
jgi:hypothetical protein